MTRRAWTQRELDMLEILYPEFSTRGLMDFLGRSEKSIYSQANIMGLKKSPEYRRFQALIRGFSKEGARNRFQPGLTPWNKGKHHSPPGSEKGRFKPGHKPHTWQPVGSYRISDGVLQRKINDNPGPARVRWRPVHELVWTEQNGPVPRGHIVVFKPGQHTTQAEAITIDKVDCITRAENMDRNRYQRLPEPLPKLIQTRAALTRKLNNRRRKIHDEKHN